MEKTYFPQVFLQPDAATAARIILMEEVGLTTEERWEVETAFLAQDIAALPEGLMIDYGCGIGRLAKVYLESHDGWVIGVDSSLTMRVQSESYVDSFDNYGAVSPRVLEVLADSGLCAEAAIAVWAFQHMPNVGVDIRRLALTLETGAPLLVVNRPERLVPMIDDSRVVHWLDDGLDLDALLLAWFTLDHEKPMPDKLCAPGAYLRLYHRKRRRDE